MASLLNLSSSALLNNVTQEPEPSVYEFDYTGAVQSQSLAAGTYKLEVWGAQGGSINTTYLGGKGGYSVGTLTLSQPTTVYIYVGGEGTGGTATGAKAGGFNGGGLGYSTTTSYAEEGGGGGTDVRIGTDSLYARVIVAGGGGGAGAYSGSARYNGGYGGGTSGGTGGQYSTSYMAGTGGSQTSAGTSYTGRSQHNASSTIGDIAGFGVGGGVKSEITNYQIAGGGGGWYGGGFSRRAGGGGGSGYVYNSSTATNYPSGCLLNSDYYLTNATMYAGNSSSMPKTDGSGNETGHEGNGYARITKI